MSKLFLPKQISSVGVPPIKCQGIKTKLIKFIAGSMSWNGKGKYNVPFGHKPERLYHTLKKKILFI